MAPEVMSKGGYAGVPNDIFGAGVILFIFMTGLPPFKNANPRDAHYGQICINRHDKFWGSHQQRLKMKFSNEFIDLISSMLSYDPTHRPSISEIMAHPWCQGETSDFDYIQNEFAHRKSIVDKEKEEEMLKKEQTKQQQQQQQRENKTQQNYRPLRAHRNAEELSTVEVNSEWTDIANMFAGTDMTVNKFKRIDKEDIRNGSLRSKDMTETELVQAVQYVCNKLKGTVKLENGNKLNLTKGKRETDDLLEVKIKFYEDQEGEKYAEFTRLNGEILSYYELVGDISDGFVKLAATK